jgi:plastocyanin
MSSIISSLGRPALVLCAGSLLLGCGGDKVGSNDLLKFNDKVGGGLGQIAASPSPKVAQGGTASAPVQNTATNHPQPVQSKPPPPPTTNKFNIDINPDTGTSESQFNPTPAAVRVGTVVVWHNKDSVARSVVADKGAFNSGSIPPGGSYSYTAGTAGTYDYSDGTRPYAVGQLQVKA